MTLTTHSFFETEAYLKKKGIKWDRKVRDAIRTPRYFGGEDITPGVHVYYMLGDCDVAYFTPLLGTLFIHKTPRRWAKEMLENCLPS